MTPRRVPLWAGLVVVFSLIAASCGPRGIQSSSAPPTSTPETVGFVPDKIAVASSDAVATGLSAAAKRFGGSVLFEGSGSLDPYKQAQYAQELVGRHPSAVGADPTDPTALCPTAALAQRAGVTFFAAGSDVACPGVGLYVEPATPTSIGSDTVDLLAKAIAGSGDVAIVSAGPTQPDVNSWIAAMQARLSAYPRLHLVPVQTGASDGTETTVVADRLMAAYPRLRGIIGASPTNVGAVARAVDQAGRRGAIAVTGVAEPGSVSSRIVDGSLVGVVSYHPEQLGYLTYWAVTQMLRHRAFSDRDTVPGLSAPVTWTAATHTLLLGPPEVVTKANVKRYEH